MAQWQEFPSVTWIRFKEIKGTVVQPILFTQKKMDVISFRNIR